MTTSESLRVEYAGTADLDEIHDLRLRAHRHDGRLTGVTAAELASPYDDDAWHLVIRHGGRIVAYMRLIDLRGDPGRSQYMTDGGHSVPAAMWEGGMLEGGAGAVEPEYRRGRLYSEIVRESVRITVRTGNRWLLGGCEDELLPGFTALGFTVVQTREVEPLPGWRFRSHLFAMTMDDLAAGRVSGRYVSAMTSALADAITERQHLLDRSA